MSQVSTEQAVDTFFETLGHRCALVDGSLSARVGALRLLDEAVLHDNPFPRRFLFRKSFYAIAGLEAANLAAEVRARLDDADEGHVLNLFCDDPEVTAEGWALDGYVLSWPFDLFAISVTATDAIDPPALPDDLRATVVDSVALVDRINADDPEYPSSAATLGDPRVHEIAVLDGDEPVAKGEIIFDARDGAHVMQMVTRPSHRRRGLGRAVMARLLAEAARRGARFAVLNASLEAARANVYPRLGFEVVTRCARLIPSGRGEPS